MCKPTNEPKSINHDDIIYLRDQTIIKYHGYVYWLSRSTPVDYFGDWTKLYQGEPGAIPECIIVEQTHKYVTTYQESNDESEGTF